MKYDGEWKDGKTSGQAVFRNQTIQFSGIIEDWKFMKGKIKIQYDKNSYYEGQIQNQLKNGSGTYRFNNQSIYRGQFQNDTFHGKGILEN